MNPRLQKTLASWVFGSLSVASLGAQITGPNAYDEAIRLNPTNALLYDERGRAHGLAGELEAAIADFTQSIQLNPYDALAFGLRGKAFSDKGDTEKVIADLNQAVRLDPRAPVARNNRGYVLAVMGKYDDALVDLDQAIRLSPQFDLPHANRGFVLLQAREVPPSVQRAEKGRRPEPEKRQNLQQHRLAYGDVPRRLPP